jgi:hypothetical protein
MFYNILHVNRFLDQAVNLKLNVQIRRIPRLLRRRHHQYRVYMFTVSANIYVNQAQRTDTSYSSVVASPSVTTSIESMFTVSANVYVSFSFNL